VNGESVLESVFLYDATVAHIDATRGQMTFVIGDKTHRVKSPHVSSFAQGAIGRLQLPTDRTSFVFQTYADQRLRRAPDLDDSSQGRWGWRIGQRSFLVKSGVLPGHNGSVVACDTEELVIALPREFVDFCKERRIEPIAILRGFVGNACSLSSVFERPREDDYRHDGIRACDLAKAYMQCVLGEHGEDSNEERPLGKRRRRRRAAVITPTQPKVSDSSRSGVAPATSVPQK
jgi:hypothetical protein